MQKQIINPSLENESAPQQTWLDLLQLAQIELTSEDGAHPIEGALTSGNADGWLAAHSGKQIIRFLFDEPQNISRVKLLFREDEQERTQEFQLRWLPAGENNYQEIVRQQYTFSPPQTIEEKEDYRVNLDAVSAFELNIVPDISRTETRASLAFIQMS